jgi:hypothetical protein
MAAAKPRPTGALKGTDLGDEFMFYDHEKDHVHVLNATAREIFLLFDGTRTAADVTVAVAEMFEIDADRARADVETTEARLRELGVIGD